ncbi:MAG: hypothetical protein WED34_09545 [Planctomycetales bacterium]
MAKRRAIDDGNDEIAALREEVVNLRDQVRVLADILDEIREELTWVTRNGVPVVPAPAQRIDDRGVLARMSADPCDSHSVQKLVIRGPSAPSRSPPATIHVTADLEETDAVEFVLDGQDQFGEIIAIDYARNQATIMLIPSQEEVVVSLDELTKVETDLDEEEPSVTPLAVPQAEQPVPSAGKPPTGKLFSSPGDQQRLL